MTDGGCRIARSVCGCSKSSRLQQSTILLSPPPLSDASSSGYPAYNGNRATSDRRQLVLPAEVVVADHPSFCSNGGGAFGRH